MSAMNSSEMTATRPAAGRWATLAMGIVAVSLGSILTRLAEAPPLAVGFWRMALATLLLTPWALPRLREEAPALGRREWVSLVLAGVSLAVHFGAWITSLELTTVASSVILVTTNPIFVGLASHYLLGEHVGRRQALAIGIAMLGSVVIGYGDLAVSGVALWGDALALLGALAMSSYMLLGRAVRKKLSTLAYVWPCYGIAAGILLALCLITGQPLTRYAPRTALMLALLALIPQIMGHSTINWALAHLSAISVTLAILGEPIGATIMAFFILGETPPLTALIGGPIIMAGIYLASRDEIATTRSPSPPLRTTREGEPHR